MTCLRIKKKVATFEEEEKNILDNLLSKNYKNMSKLKKRREKNVLRKEYTVGQK